MASAEKQETQETQLAARLLVSPAAAASPSGCLVRAAGGGRSNLGEGGGATTAETPATDVACR